jgi:hypothetical protein
MHTICVPLVPLLPALLLACGGDGSGGPPPPASLAVESVRPPDGSTAADPLSPVVVTFDAALDPATATAQAIPITRGGPPVAGSATYDAASRSVEIDAPLLPGASYDAAVETTIEGEGGGQLDQRFEWSFATRPWESSAVGPTPGSHGLAMATDPDGRLHLLFWAPVPAGGMELRYATCATQCLVPANWTAVALDQANSGGPAAILADGGPLEIAYQNSSTAKLLYATCSTACTGAAGWEGVQLDLAPDEGHQAVGLGRDGTGVLHLATVVGTGAQYGIAYASCAAGCTTATNWQATVLAPIGDRPSLIAEPAGRRHLIYRDPATSTMRYATCAAGCGTAGSWDDVPVDPTASTFTGTALSLDDEGGLHTVYLASGGVRYATCSSGCDASGGWQSTGISDAGDLRVHVGLALGDNGRVHVIYGRGTHLEYATCVTDCVARANWQVTEGLPGADTRHLALVRDAAGGLHLAFEDVATLTAGYAE